MIVEAYKDSLNEKIIQLNWNENDISSEIHKYVKENPLRIKWKISSNVEAHIPKNTSKVKGISLKGGEEIRPGYKDFDELADILEALEIED